MLEVIIMILGTIVISVIMLLVLLLVIVLILVSYDRYLARKMGKRRKKTPKKVKVPDIHRRGYIIKKEQENG
jgi:membrane protein implicated in regulation of membrane protease activity